ncbi:MAG: hypothetical protein ORN28_08260 [Rhodoferax sp.]|nr:hypothetical protein [Rhodoferax sp.]
MNPFIVSAVAEKWATMKTANYFAKPAQRGTCVLFVMSSQATMLGLAECWFKSSSPKFPVSPFLGSARRSLPPSGGEPTVAPHTN